MLVILTLWSKSEQDIFTARYNLTRYQYNNVLAFRVIWVINDKTIEERVNKRKQEKQ